MNINWFPGHMSKSLREIDDRIKLAGAVIYVLDSRAPLSCINPAFDEIIKNKPTVYVFNKADMVKAGELASLMKRFDTPTSVAVKLNATNSGAGKIISEKLIELSKDYIAKKQEKGVRAVIRAVVIGVPNSGKSTLINNLCGKGKTVTGNKAGVTKMQQLIRVSDYLEVVDTPGTLYPKLDNYFVALNLAFIGSIKDEVLDIYGVSLELIKRLTELRTGIKERYGIEPSGDAEKDLELIGRKRGFIEKGGEVNLERAAYAVIDDFRKGRMGKIILDRLS
ncbi:MAG: ribosome biogenesis GTPase YlqF [Clostridia bacterium]|nr:ribosome biogenesis GTPase YlqF [Clostridia bacterium]